MRDSSSGAYVSSANIERHRGWMQASDTTTKAPGRARKPMNKIRLYMSYPPIFTKPWAKGKRYARRELDAHQVLRIATRRAM